VKLVNVECNVWFHGSWVFQYLVLTCSHDLCIISFSINQLYYSLYSTTTCIEIPSTHPTSCKSSQFIINHPSSLLSFLHFLFKNQTTQFGLSFGPDGRRLRESALTFRWKRPSILESPTQPLSFLPQSLASKPKEDLED